MGEKVRYMMEGSIKDREAFLTLAKRLSQEVETTEPDTLAYEWFVSDDRFWIHEMFSTEAAFLAHFNARVEKGQIDELLSIADLDRVVLLTEPKGEQVKAIAEQFGGVQYHGIGGVVR